MYVRYDNCKINDPASKYKDLIKPNTIKPGYERYELHLVWILEGTLKDGVRHIYHKRRLYAGEDTWMALWADNYDARGQLWRVAFVNYFYSQESKTFHRGASIYHDLTAKAYEAGRSEEHTSELQSLMRISYAVFCLKTKKPYTVFRKSSQKNTH